MSDFRHIVLFRVRDGVAPAEVDAALRELRRLADLPGVRSWRIERSLDERKGQMIVEDATFDDEGAFKRFRTAPEHRAVSERMAEISDWWVGDYRA